MLLDDLDAKCTRTKHFSLQYMQHSIIKKKSKEEKRNKNEKNKKMGITLNPDGGEPIIFAKKKDIAISSQFLLVNLNKRNFKIVLKQRMLSKKTISFL